MQVEGANGRSSHGERGLKWRGRAERAEYAASLPTRGAWIEIFVLLNYLEKMWSLPTRGAWIEIANPALVIASAASHSLHGERSYPGFYSIDLCFLRMSAG